MTASPSPARAGGKNRGRSAYAGSVPPSRFPWLLLAVLVSGACTRPREDHSIDPAGPPAHADSLTQTIEREGHVLRLPAGWQEHALETPQRRDLFAFRFDSPSGQPDVRVAVGRPTPHQGGVDALAATLRAIGGARGTAAPAQLSGLDGVVLTDEAQTPRGKVVRLRFWGAVRDDMAIMLMCSGTGEDGVALAERLCPRIAAGYRAPAPNGPPRAR